MKNYVDEDKQRPGILLILQNYERYSYYVQVVENFSTVYFGHASNPEKSILNYYSREIPKLLPFISELRRNWEQKKEKPWRKRELFEKMG